MKIVLTGGPCAGKSTVLRAVLEEFAGKVTVVPEGATILLEGGFPVPGTHLPWSQRWQGIFERALGPLQVALEDAYALSAEAKGHQVIVMDRGILDGAAYLPDGIEELGAYLDWQEGDYEKTLNRYDSVLHLTSLSVTDPDKYVELRRPPRFEPVERAKDLELKTREVWRGHPFHRIVSGSIQDKISSVIGEITRYLETIDG